VGLRLLRVLVPVAACVVLAASAGAAPKPVWKGTVTISASGRHTTFFGDTSTFTYSAKAVYPGKWWPGHGWRGTLTYAFTGTLKLAPVTDCTYTGSGSYPVSADIGLGGGVDGGGPIRLSVSVYFNPAKKFVGKVSEVCKEGPLNNPRPDAPLATVRTVELNLSPKTTKFARRLKLPIAPSYVDVPKAKADVRLSFQHK
jgi:hypothetical protein